jgi:small conductance mechanosensitive channel
MEIELQDIINKIVDYVPQVVGAIILLIVGFWLAGWVTRLLRRGMQRRKVDESIQPFFASLVNTGLKVLVLISVAGMFGFETTSFVAILGALVFAIGMALQGSLGHFASGVMILTFKPYKVGDLVELDGKTGVVKEIGVFNTVMMTVDNKKVIIPNGVVTSGTIVNISGPGEIRVDMTFGIGYSDDIDKARKVIQQVADSCEQVDKSKPVDIFVSELADSSVNFAVRPWCKSEHFWDVYFYMHENIKKSFDQQGISIPFPQMDVHTSN